MSRENSNERNELPSIDQIDSLDDVIAWCLLKQDAGEYLDQQSIIATFPGFKDELRAFFSTEQVFDHITAQPLRLPQQVAHYELGEVLGRGSFGEVRRAWDQRLHRSVAIKFPRFLTDEKSLERFMREARTTSQLSHPNIVTTHEIGEHEDTPYIVAEYVEGIPLHQWGERPLDTAVAIDLAQKIADAIDHAHSLGVIHRDLNPRNILIDLDGQPKILDFGLAKCLDDLGTVTIRGDVLGTPAYVSPEQIGGG
ncbi:MAG: serine/threonine-protein kinase, partial [Planctomycetota bacterium]